MNHCYGAAGAIHFVMQAKGGVGKSHVASHVAQYFTDHGQQVKVFDSDPTTPTLSRYKALDATYFNFMSADDLDMTKFDELATGIVDSSKEVVIVDTGSSNFIPLTSYLKSQGIFQVFADMGRPVVVHSVVVGGSGARETVGGLVTMVESLSAPQYVVWLNSFFGPLQFEGKSFEDTRAFAEVRGKLGGIVRLKERSAGQNTLHLNAVRKMTERHMTYREVFESDEFTLWEKQRLKEAQREVNEQLALILPVGVREPAVAAAK